MTSRNFGGTATLMTPVPSPYLGDLSDVINEKLKTFLFQNCLLDAHLWLWRICAVNYITVSPSLLDRRQWIWLADVARFSRHTSSSSSSSLSGRPLTWSSFPQQLQTSSRSPPRNKWLDQLRGDNKLPSVDFLEVCYHAGWVTRRWRMLTMRTIYYRCCCYCCYYYYYYYVVVVVIEWLCERTE